MKIFGLVAPALQFVISANQGTTTGISTSIGTSLPTMLIDLKVGAGLEYWVTDNIGLSLAGRYGLGITNLNGSLSSYTSGYLRSIQVLAAVSYGF